MTDNVIYRVTGPQGDVIASADSLSEAEGHVFEVQQWTAESDEGPWRGVDYVDQAIYWIEKFVL